MASYPDMRELARFATENYSSIDSIDRFRPPFPAQGTPNWWAMRQRYEELLLARVRRDRNGARLAGPSTASKVAGADLNHEAHANSAKWAALGNEDADVDYQRAGKSREWWLATWNPAAAMKRPDWLAGQLEAATRGIT